MQKPSASNLYETIIPSADVPADKEKKVKEKEPVKVASPEPKKVKKNNFDVLLNPVTPERKTASIFLRVKPSVKKAFEEICDAKDVSQADMFSFWVESIVKKQ